MTTDLMRLRDVELELDVCRDTLYRWISNGKLRAVMVGSQYRVHRSELERITSLAGDRVASDA